MKDLFWKCSAKSQFSAVRWQTCILEINSQNNCSLVRIKKILKLHTVLFINYKSIWNAYIYFSYAYQLTVCPLTLDGYWVMLHRSCTRIEPHVKMLYSCTWYSTWREPCVTPHYCTMEAPCPHNGIKPACGSAAHSLMWLRSLTYALKMFGYSTLFFYFTYFDIYVAVKKKKKRLETHTPLKQIIVIWCIHYQSKV